MWYPEEKSTEFILHGTLINSNCSIFNNLAAFIYLGYLFKALIFYSFFTITLQNLDAIFHNSRHKTHNQRTKYTFFKTPTPFSIACI